MIGEYRPILSSVKSEEIKLSAYSEFIPSDRSHEALEFDSSPILMNIRLILSTHKVSKFRVDRIYSNILFFNFSYLKLIFLS